MTFTRRAAGMPTRLHDSSDCQVVAFLGGNTGIGKATALHLARRGARVILACRNRTKAQAAITDIQEVEQSQQRPLKSEQLASTLPVLLTGNGK